MMEHSDRQRALAERAMRAGQPKRAIQLLREVLTHDPHDAHAHALLALCLHDDKRLEAAQFEARLALGLAPESGTVHHALGVILTSKRQFREAEEHLALARADALDSAAVSLAFARLRSLQGRRAEELAELERARGQAPDDPDVLATLGEAYRERGRYAEAEASARAALNEEPEHAEALVLMGHLLLQRGELASARDHALWVLQSDANHVGGLVLLTAVKARSSVWLGAWWRYHSWMTAIGEARSMLVLLSAFALYRVALVAVEQAGRLDLIDWVINVWLAVCLYTWVGPLLFRRALEKELRKVELKHDF